jgi:hypothetical protein
MADLHIPEDIAPFPIRHPALQRRTGETGKTDDRGRGRGYHHHPATKTHIHCSGRVTDPASTHGRVAQS